ncbi:unnamed protein product [Protopolystoma xenopodis]|uniref:IBB domain-containing protein n=1 Tax=Protopolystoma xenopodis TaxID=117903 RepID=A0A3S5ALF8_9PLAT|nr:unnamed protein product [Protopolystoma xenopodis]
MMADTNSRLNAFKNAGKSVDEMRRRRQEGQVELRKNKREETRLKKRNIPCDIEGNARGDLVDTELESNERPPLLSLEDIVANAETTNPATKLMR